MSKIQASLCKMHSLSSDKRVSHKSLSTEGVEEFLSGKNIGAHQHQQHVELRARRGEKVKVNAL